MKLGNHIQKFRNYALLIELLLIRYDVIIQS